MLQLMRFNVYFKGILNTDNGYFHIKIMISAGHMLGGSWACSLRKFLKKMPRSLSSLTIWGPSDQFLLIQYGGPSQISFIVYYTGPPLRSVSLHAIGGPPHILFFSPNIWGPPQISFSAYYMGLG